MQSVNSCALKLGTSRNKKRWHMGLYFNLTSVPSGTNTGVCVRPG